MFATRLERARAEPVLTTPDVNLVFDKPQLRVEIDRDRARDLGISALDVAETLQLSLSEQRLGFFIMDGKQFEIIGQVERDRPRPPQGASIYVSVRDIVQLWEWGRDVHPPDRALPLLALAYPDRVGLRRTAGGTRVLLDGGRVVQTGPTRELLADGSLMEAHGLEVPLSIRLAK